jgi:hypothetical protein
VSDGQSPPGRGGHLSERERTRIEGSFGAVLVLLLVTVFFSISAPDEPWAELATAVVLAITLSITMLASGARRRIGHGRFPDALGRTRTCASQLVQ